MTITYDLCSSLKGHLVLWNLWALVSHNCVLFVSEIRCIMSEETKTYQPNVESPYGSLDPQCWSSAFYIVGTWYPLLEWKKEGKEGERKGVMWRRRKRRDRKGKRKEGKIEGEKMGGKMEGKKGRIGRKEFCHILLLNQETPPLQS